MDGVASFPRAPLETLARRLARTHETEAAPRRAGRRLRARLNVLERAHETIAHNLHEQSAREDFGTSVEWILDNQHLVAEALLQVEEDLAPGFYGELARLAGTGRRDEPRIFALARAVVEEGSGHLDPERARRFLVAYQTVAPLTMGELWAFPAVVRLAVLEDLVHAGAQLSDHPFRGRSELARIEWEHRSAPVDERIPACIGSLRVAASEDWLAFFEETSRVERTLRRDDPVGVYGAMDFGTRDRYRKAVEALASRTDHSEEEVADVTTRTAGAEAEGSLGRHVGHHLVGAGREALEERLGYTPPLSVRAGRWLENRAVPVYLGGIALLSVAVLYVLLLPLRGAGPNAVTLAILLTLVPSTTVAVAVVNRLLSQLLPPRVLPKLAHEEGIPAGSPTVVAVPCILSDRDDIEALTRQLELNYQGNRDASLRFALLSDFPDAPEREMPGDRPLLEEARARIRTLNREHGEGDREDGNHRFFLFHRPRRWNPSEGVWMGRERKRGKLSEFNHLLLGADDTDFTAEVGRTSEVRGARYVVTLDADTFLPPGTARRLVGILDHPLNHPRLDDDGRLRSGYTVLQPRIETYSEEGATSLFARIYEADRGLDLYSHAVSDVYQDLFGTGIFAGKGIYHVEAFERTLEGRTPDNALLSHDLFEGLHGRAALVTDVMVFEDFPEHFLAYAKRLHRWVRGDWQLLPWLLPEVPAEDGGRVPSRFGLLGRWMVADNLRRGLLATSLMALLLAGWFVLPGPWWWWTGGVALVLATPILLGSPVLFRARVGISPHWASLREHHQLPAVGLLRWGAGLLFLPYQAYVETDAVLRTLYRLAASRRHLLEWTTQAHTARALADRSDRRVAWLRMAPAPLLAVASAAGLLAVLPRALPFVAPLLAGWLLSPELARILSRRRPQAAGQGLSPDDEAWLRLLARRTWAYFERFVGPEGHWLPPDHFQEEPRGEAAFRTSPTNIGLMLTSALGAHDLGYVSLSGLVAILRNTFDAMDSLERHRGHFLNWYDTRDLTPLAPRYVSMVDSGNLAGSLVALKEGLLELLETPIARKAIWSGLEDSLAVLEDAVRQLPKDEAEARASVLRRVRELREAMRSPAEPGEDDHARLRRLMDEDLAALEGAIARVADEGARDIEPGSIARIRAWLVRLRHETGRLEEDLARLTPWTRRRREIEAWGREGPETLQDDFRALDGALPEAADLRSIPRACDRLEQILDELDEPGSAGNGPDEAPEQWVAAFREELAAARIRAAELSGALEELAADAHRWVAEMDFSFLYDRQRKLFHVGYDVTRGELDRSYYDLLASEARGGSLLAVAKGDVSPEHWLQLGRPFGKLQGSAVLLSWAGTAFEYLMPLLMNRNPRGTLLELNLRAAVRSHRTYGEQHGIPWGISESAYYELDAHGTYQYRAFGVPGLGIRRDPGTRNVVAPYASALALPVAPEAAVRNLRRLEDEGMMGPYGLYEAVDYGPPRDGRRGRGRIVRSFMAHHQGMIFVSIVNRLRNGVMVDRFHRDPAIRAVEYLLHERAPRQVRLEPPTPEPVSAPTPAAGAREVEAWEVPSTGERPSLHHLSNGTLTSFVTARGAGGLRWRDRAATAWTASPVDANRGLWIYLRDEASGRRWSATPAPMDRDAPAAESVFSPHEVEYVRRVEEVLTRLRVTVAPGADVEIRRLLLRNESETTRRIRVTTYGEVALTDPNAFARHPAFARLFVDAGWDDDLEALVFRRRKASPDEPGMHLAHALEVPEGGGTNLWWETDRERFLGRWGSPGRPAALDDGWEPGGVEGAPLDPVFSITRVVTLRPGGRAEVLALTAVGSTRKRTLGHLDVYRSPGRAGWAFEQARAHELRRLGTLGIPPSRARIAQRVLSAALHPFHGLRARGAPEGGVLRRDVLWGLGLSGDHPVVLVTVSDPDPVAVVGDLIRFHARWRSAGVPLDLVVVDEALEGYDQPVRDWLLRILSRVPGSGRLGEDAGVHHVPAARLAPEQRRSLEAAASVVLDGDGPSLDEQLAELESPPERLPPFVPASPPVRRVDVPAPTPPPELLMDNGYGGFTPDGDEYVIRLGADDPPPPAPWINVVADEKAGFLISERGSGYSWATNSGEHRLTRWSNDPVRDPATEALYLRDETTGEVWTPTPGPRGDGCDHLAAHGIGYTRFVGAGRGLAWELRYDLVPEEATRVVELRVENPGPEARRLTATYYAEWVLGTLRSRTAPHLVTDWRPADEVLVCRNDWAPTPGPGVAYLAADAPVVEWTADRQEFLGTTGPSDPAGLGRIGLTESAGSGFDPCGALQVDLPVPPGERRTVRFFLGAADDERTAADRIARLREPRAVSAARRRTATRWRQLLGTITVETPEPAMDLLLNRWALYQTVSCRLWGRSGFYQSSGAFGFRDQLQDVLAFRHAAPSMTRRQILSAARHQFVEGDVLHWWHPPGGEGIRTRCSDDLLWLPYAVASYLYATGDDELLDETVPFLAGPELEPGEDERYDRYRVAGEEASVYEHAVRALRRGLTRGPRGLPLMGSGDWNDGMDRVGREGTGESVWLGWFGVAIARRFAPICERAGDGHQARWLRRRATEMEDALREAAWDGRWYLRAFYDDGTPLGSSRGSEPRIDSIAQSWAVLSGAGDPERSEAALDAAEEMLVQEDERLVRLLTPPFDLGDLWPGYIRAYPPGIRENGGQYTHAAAWLGWAWAARGEGERAERIFRILNPLLRAADRAGAERYRIEPYVLAGDIGAHSPHVGRGGWSWYTGSAAWVYRLGVEAILGLRPAPGGLIVDPCIPPSWPGFRAVHRSDGGVLELTVENPDGVSSGVVSVTLDGRTLEGTLVPLPDDGERHTVVVRLGGAENGAGRGKPGGAGGVDPGDPVLPPPLPDADPRKGEA